MMHHDGDQPVAGSQALCKTNWLQKFEKRTATASSSFTAVHWDLTLPEGIGIRRKPDIVTTLRPLYSSPCTTVATIAWLTTNNS